MSSRFFDAAALDEQRALVALSLVPGVGPGRIRALLARFGTAVAALAAPRHALSAVPGMGPRTAAAVAAFGAHAEVAAQLTRAEAAGAHLLTPQDDAFPALLRQIYDPPAFLWVRGTLTDADARAVAIVGTRRATDYGRRTARAFAADLAGRGFTVVSGLAYGVDAAAHEGALDAGGRTLAVLGSGVDRIYPGRHAALARRIAGAGALLSEYPLGAAPDAVNFPRRNRIVSGLALGTVVVEAHEAGGALITARLALAQNREVFAVPSPVHVRAGVGTNRLIRDGHAKLVATVEDVLDELGAPFGTPPAAAPPASAPPDLPPLERRLLDALTPDPVHLDALCLATALDPSTALVHLLGLEFKGLVRQLAGKQFYRVR